MARQVSFALVIQALLGIVLCFKKHKVGSVGISNCVLCSYLGISVCSYRILVIFNVCLMLHCVFFSCLCVYCILS